MNLPQDSGDYLPELPLPGFNEVACEHIEVFFTFKEQFDDSHQLAFNVAHANRVRKFFAAAVVEEGGVGAVAVGDCDGAAFADGAGDDKLIAVHHRAATVADTFNAVLRVRGSLRVAVYAEALNAGGVDIIIISKVAVGVHELDEIGVHKARHKPQAP